MFFNVLQLKKVSDFGDEKSNELKKKHKDSLDRLTANFW